MAKMDPLQYLETLKPMIEKSLATQVALRTEAVAATELPTDGTKQSFVDAGALMSFTERLTRQHREDVLNGTLLAQRAADAVADRTKQEEAWYGKYVEVLSHIGWVIQSFNFQRYTRQGKSFFINKALLDIVKDLLSKDELGHIEHTIESLGNDDNQPWWHVFSKESSGPSENGNFRSAHATKMKVDRSSWSLVHSTFKAVKPVTGGCGFAIIPLRCTSSPALRFAPWMKMCMPKCVIRSKKCSERKAMTTSEPCICSGAVNKYSISSSRG